MANVWVTEYAGIGHTEIGVNTIPAKRWPAIKTTKVNFTGTDSSVTFDSRTRVVRLYADAIIYVNLTEAADGNDEPIPASMPVDRVLTEGGQTLYMSDGS